MKQVFHNLKDGKSNMPEIPAPDVPNNKLLIRTTHSLLSAGTERMLLDFSKASLLGKAQQQPDKVKKTIEKAKNDGILSTVKAINSSLDQSIPLGYCNVGEVVAVGKDIKGFNIGDRVVSNGPHSELVTVSENLCEIIPEGVSNQEAVFTVLGSIGLQGIRLANPSFGETFLISGLGLIGILTGQILLSNGCRVIGIDPDPERCRIAESLGIKTLCLSSNFDPVNWCNDITNGIGIDGVLITASTSSNQPIELAAKVCRQRGRIILIGVTGLELRRDLFYQKELSFQVSCSYGPGRYDKSYEDDGVDYPIGYVRWTEKRNFGAILNAISQGVININSLISHRFPFEKIEEAFSLLTNKSSALGIVIEYSKNVDEKKRTIKLSSTNKKYMPKLNTSVGLIGAGNYAERFLLPSFKKTGVKFDTIVSSNGAQPFFVGNKFSFKKASTDFNEILTNKNCNSVVVATRHDSHASLIKRSLKAKKNIFVEKPLCLNQDELREISNIYDGSQILMVGFNRRFSPLIKELKSWIAPKNTRKAFIYTCNAGFIPKDHWTQDPKIGGGRLIGEACHFVDLLRYLSDVKFESMSITDMFEKNSSNDNFTINIKFQDGSIGTIHYYSNGNVSFPKERLEVFTDGCIFQLDNFRKLKAWGVKGFKTIRYLNQNKGQDNCIKEFVDAVEHKGINPIPFDEIYEVHDFIFRAIKP